MIAHQPEHEDADSTYFFKFSFTFFFSSSITTITDNEFIPSAPATIAYTASDPDIHLAPGTKRKETPATTSAETTVVTKKIKVEGSGSRGRIQSVDFDEMTRSIIEDTILIYRAQISSVEPFPERTDDRDTIKQAWLEVCTGRNVRVELEEDIFKLVSESTSFFLHFVAIKSLFRLSDVLHKHEAMLRRSPSHIL
jgi:hypothetical protein